MLRLLIALLLLSSCASGREFKIKDVAMEKRVWRHCHIGKDGPAHHEKGFCYISQKCKSRFILKDKCLPVPMFCAYGDIQCLRDNKWPAIKSGLK